MIDIEKLLNKIDWELFVKLRNLYISSKGYNSILTAEQLRDTGKRLLQDVLEDEKIISSRTACLIASRKNDEGMITYHLDFCVGDYVDEC